jgi:hypothetical protein
MVLPDTVTSPQTNNCGASLAAGHSCSIAVSFTTTGTGTRSGSVSFSALVARRVV